MVLYTLFVLVVVSVNLAICLFVLMTKNKHVYKAMLIDKRSLEVVRGQERMLAMVAVISVLLALSMILNFELITNR